MAVVVPGSTVKVMVVQHGLFGARVGEVDVLELDLAGGRAGRGGGVAGAATDGSVSSTSPMRFAHTAARGIMTNMKVAIMTPMRICMR